jgi:hypothetical protein
MGFGEPCTGNNDLPQQLGVAIAPVKRKTIDTSAVLIGGYEALGDAIGDSTTIRAGVRKSWQRRNNRAGPDTAARARTG